MTGQSLAFTLAVLLALSNVLPTSFVTTRTRMLPNRARMSIYVTILDALAFVSPSTVAITSETIFASTTVKTS